MRRVHDSQSSSVQPSRRNSSWIEMSSSTCLITCSGGSWKEITFCLMLYIVNVCGGALPSRFALLCVWVFLPSWLYALRLRHLEKLTSHVIKVVKRFNADRTPKGTSNMTILGLVLMYLQLGNFSMWSGLFRYARGALLS